MPCTCLSQACPEWMRLTKVWLSDVEFGISWQPEITTAFQTWSNTARYFGVLCSVSLPGPVRPCRSDSACPAAARSGPACECLQGCFNALSRGGALWRLHGSEALPGPPAWQLISVLSGFCSFDIAVADFYRGPLLLASVISQKHLNVNMYRDEVPSCRCGPCRRGSCG